jgi:putative addiction module killer protein
MVEIRKYRDALGRIPFDDWMGDLRDRRARMRVKIRIDRLSLGLGGDWKAVGEGVRELRIPEGKGYRVYYAWDGNTAVILLCGGNKHSQRSDIEAAKSYWRDYCEG